MTAAAVAAVAVAVAEQSTATTAASSSRCAAVPAARTALVARTPAAAPHSNGGGRGPAGAVAGEARPSAGAAPPQAEGPRPVVDVPPAAHAANKEEESATDEKNKNKTVLAGIWATVVQILLHSWLNALLVFVPLGIAVRQIPGMPPGAVFALNAVAIIPLAGLLGYATESVAHRMGDSVGALLNITFGNAVELIICEHPSRSPPPLETSTRLDPPFTLRLLTACAACMSASSN